jgi:hypothetical protein
MNKMSVALILLGSLVGCISSPAQLPDASVVQTWLQSALPLGSSRATTVAFLRSHKINGHYPIESNFEIRCVSDSPHEMELWDEGVSDGCFFESPFNGGRNGLFHMDSPRTIIATVNTPVADRSFIWCDLTLMIGFDKRERVDLRRVSQECTGP